MADKSNYQRWREHRRKVKIERIKHKQSWNANTIIVALIALIGVLIVSLAIVLGLLVGAVRSGFDSASNSVIGAISDHPALAAVAIGYANDQHVPDSMAALAVLSEMSGGGKVQGAFKGHFTTRNDTELHKLDPSCHDEYSYRTIAYNLSHEDFILQTTKATDEGYEQSYVSRPVWRCKDDACEEINQSVIGGFALYRRNEHTCMYTIVQREKPDEFIPDTIDVRSIEAQYGGAK